MHAAALPFLKPPPPINLGGIPIQVFGMIVAAGVLIGAAILTLGLWMKARLEERFLRAELGAAAYDDYARRTPMLAPFLR